MLCSHHSSYYVFMYVSSIAGAVSSFSPVLMLPRSPQLHLDNAAPGEILKTGRQLPKASHDIGPLPAA